MLMITSFPDLFKGIIIGLILGVIVMWLVAKDIILPGLL